LGSNAGLPIVGGSILAHEHYQGGRHTFPIERAEVVESAQVKDIKLERLYWPLSVIRLSSSNKEKIIQAAKRIFDYWEQYTNPDAGILSHTDGIPHNAITPIARKQDDTYILDMTFRNNRTSEEFPLGIFHPHPENHHIKKENIGLIEVMGLAVLPARLEQELPAVEEALKQNQPLPKDLEKHQAWLNEIKTIYNQEEVTTFVKDQVAIKFMKCIEDAGVFKQNAEGNMHFKQFFKEVQDVLN
jgi:UDPglucose--hexose-1-phosphate uridylyltransferase